MSDGKRRTGQRGLMGLGAALAAAAFVACGGGGSGSGSGAVASGTPTASAPAAPAKHPPKRLEGSGAALSDDGQHVLVADEDHEAIVVAPASFADLSGVRVVPMPGPPAQIVVASDLVLVTVRTLPTEDAQAARAEVRGPLPDATKTHRLGTVQLSRWSPGRMAPAEYKKYLDDGIVDPPPAAASATASASPAPSDKPSPQKTASASASASAAPKSPPPPKVPPSKPFDPNVVRKSQGGLLLVMKPDAEKGLVEVGRVLLPADAWGLGVTPDGMRAVVTSAWTAQISVVDVNARKSIATLKVAREPRGVTISQDGKTAYVSHLVGTDLTKIEGLDGTPAASVQPLPAAPPRTLESAPAPTASLGYSLVMSPDGESVYVPRHAIGAEGYDSWWGAPVVDVLDRKSGKPVAPAHRKNSPSLAAHIDEMPRPMPWSIGLGRMPEVPDRLVQPRAVVYRKSTDTLLVAGEGFDNVLELDALGPDPAMFMRNVYSLAVYDEWGHQAVRGGAPSALALSEDENTLYVYCHTTYDLARIDLKQSRGEFLRLADDGLSGAGVKGRKLFANANSSHISGGLACAACHPEGRDDGHTWREVMLDEEHGPDEAVFVAYKSTFKDPSGPFEPGDKVPPRKFYPRQTPMIAGRARSEGPYGWHAEAANLAERLKRGFRLHRGSWNGYIELSSTDGRFMTKIEALRDFLRAGLLPPPVVEHPLTDQEKKGQEIFGSDQAQCVKCHVATSEFTDRTAYPLKSLPVLPGFDAEKNASFKTPSLLFIGGTAPYFHDGSQASLEDLVKNNGSRMGQTSHLSADDQAALVAYLRTL